MMSERTRHLIVELDMPNTLSSKIAHEIALKIEQFSLTNNFVVIGLCGGKSVLNAYQALVPLLLSCEKEVLEKLHFFVVDERITDNDSDLNETLVMKSLLAPLIESGRIGKDQFHSFKSSKEGGSVTNDIVRYGRELNKYGGRFNIAILGAGEDGHCAALFPAHPSIRDKSEGFIWFNNSPKLPLIRISASASLLKKTKFGVLIFTGDNKGRALELYIKDATIVQCPCKVVDFMDSCIVATNINCKIARQLSAS